MSEDLARSTPPAAANPPAHPTRHASGDGDLDLLSDGTAPGRPLDGLTPHQRDVARHQEAFLVVSGVAGSGKTRALEARFRWLVAQGTRAERIAVVVPTAARAEALRARIEERLTAAYDQLFILTPAQLAALVLRAGGDGAEPVLGPGDRLAMLVERIDELSLRHHDIGGRPNALLAGFVRRIDRLKAELVGCEAYAQWAGPPCDDEPPERALEREFAELYRAHNRMLRQAGARDDGDLLTDALDLLQRRPTLARRFDHLLADDAHELDLAAARLMLTVGAADTVTVAGDPHGALHRFRGAGAERMAAFTESATRVIELGPTQRCAGLVWDVARVAAGHDLPPRAGDAPATDVGDVELWRCANERSQAQAVAVDIERVLARDVHPVPRVAVLVPDVRHDGQAIGVALEERAIAYRIVGEAAFFQRAEIRDVLAWLRLLADPTDAGAVVRALARPPIELRSVDIARCTQIARRRKLDMVSALAAAIEAPQVPPEARERIRVFLKLYRASMAAIDTSRPDVYVHRLIERLGLRRQQLFAAQPDVVERLRALARFGELASAFVSRSPQATPREFARSIGAVADFGLREQEEPDLGAVPGLVQVVGLSAAGGLEADHVYVVGLHAGMAAPASERIPDALLQEPVAPEDEATAPAALRRELYVACSRARGRLVLAHARARDRGAGLSPAPILDEIREALGLPWHDREEELFGPGEALHSTYRLLRDELLEGTMRAGSRLGELRFDTDLDVSHAVVRYLELLKLAALIDQGAGDGSRGVADALRDINSRILQAVTAEQREIFTSSPLDDYLLDTERDARRRAQALVARDEPSLEPFLPRRGEGVVLSASDIDTYRTCPLKYKFARVFRIPQEPTLHQRFGILVHQVLERYHAGDSDSLPELLGLLEAGWRRGGFGDSEEERQLHTKAATSLTRYHERFRTESAQPVWFERQFTFKLGRHVLRGRVDRVDRLPDGAYELIDYKTGRPKSAEQLADDVQLSLYAVGAREAWELDGSRQAYYYLLDDQKVEVPGDERDRGEWVREVAMEVAEGIQSQGFEPTPSLRACGMCDYRLVCPAAEL